ncbi:alginate export family protein [Paludibaculum fermentans]|uniref:Alginate export family protein n=1 Tax=Paludibaculum fermentans TaxID=1473598 RepID=A0A7S7SLZ2_PALFE|nr:alginate export family protein [Paludibaculum fermentans]QOY89874.1 alginate export family protein [Paludibaculum fermentans]
MILLIAAQRGTLAQTGGQPEGLISRYAGSELPGWLRLGGEERVRLEALGGIGFKPASNAYLLQRLRFNLEAAPVRWLKFSFQAQDARSFLTNVSPAPSSQKDPLDLRLGYVQIGEAESGWISVRAGRQSLSFGEGRLVADPNWSNVGRTLDGVRVTVHYRGLRLDGFSGASDRIYTDGFDTPTPGQHFHGLNGLLDRLIPNAVLEPYVFWRLEHDIRGEKAGPGHLDTKTAGFRWAGRLPARMDYGVEVAVQRGRQAGEPVAAWAGHWVVGHTLKEQRHRPRVYVEFNRASGDRDARDGVHGAFDPLFPSAHDKFGVADQFTWTNSVHARSGLQYKLRQNLTIGTAYNSFWLADRHDGIYSGGKVVIGSNGQQGSHIGQEADFQLQWSATRLTAVDAGFGHIFPGEFLRKAGRGSAYNCFLLGITQRF